MLTKLQITKDDIKSGAAKSYQCGKSTIVVCNLSGKYFALSNVCTHADGELVDGEKLLAESCELECPLHGARFDVRTGEAKRMPAVAPIKTYKVNEKDDELEIEVD